MPNFLDSSAAGALLCAGVACSPCTAQATTPTSVFIPFTNITQGQTELTSSPTIPLSLNGNKLIHFTMDTGSTGIVVSSDNYTPPDGSVSEGPGQITYSSSGITLTGNLYTTPVTVGTGAATAATSIELLVATESTLCPPDGGSCTQHPAHDVAMCGVGFGQENAGMPDGTPATNPFLHLTEINGVATTVPPAYVVQSTGVTLGAAPGLIKHFRQVPLTWNPQTLDWSRAPVTMHADGWTGSGTALMDTGVGDMYFKPPYGESVSSTTTCTARAPCPIAGTRIKIQVGPPGASYAFVMGANGVPAKGTAAMPGAVTLIKPSTTPGDLGFVNTTYHIFNQFDYVYDYTTGIVGFRRSTTARQ